MANNFCKGLKRNGPPQHQHDNRTHKLRLLTAEEKRTFGPRAEAEKNMCHHLHLREVQGQDFCVGERECPQVILCGCDVSGPASLRSTAHCSKAKWPKTFFRRRSWLRRDHEKAPLEVIDSWKSVGPENAAVSDQITESAAKKRRNVARFNSVPREQRTEEFNTKPARRAQVPQARTGLQPKRASPLQLVVAKRETGILLDLKGEPCPVIS